MSFRIDKETQLLDFGSLGPPKSGSNSLVDKAQHEQDIDIAIQLALLYFDGGNMEELERMIKSLTASNT